MKTITTILLIIITGTVLGVAVNCISLLSQSMIKEKTTSFCKQEITKEDSFEIYG